MFLFRFLSYKSGVLERRGYPVLSDVADCHSGRPETLQPHGFRQKSPPLSVISCYLVLQVDTVAGKGKNKGKKLLMNCRNRTEG